MRKNKPLLESKGTVQDITKLRGIVVWKNKRKMLAEISAKRKEKRYFSL